MMEECFRTVRWNVLLASVGVVSGWQLKKKVIFGSYPIAWWTGGKVAEGTLYQSDNKSTSVGGQQGKFIWLLSTTKCDGNFTLKALAQGSHTLRILAVSNPIFSKDKSYT